MMTVSYKNTFKDMAWFLLRCSLQPRQLIVVLIVPIAVAFHMMYALSEENPVYALVIVFLLIVTILSIIIFAINFFVAILLMISKSNKVFLCEHTITVNEEMLIEETEFNRSEHYWKGITKITRTHEYIYLFVSRNMAHIIPVKVFKDSNSVEEFVNFCKTMKSKSRRVGRAHAE